MSIWAWFDSGEGREAAIPLAVIFLGFAVALLTWGFRAVEFYERGAVERAV
jgi:hypothetical protein